MKLQWIFILSWPALADSNPLAEHINVSRTGYAEKDVIDPQTKNLKISGGFSLQDHQQS